MEYYTIQQDIPVLCVQAVSFPEGIPAAFDVLRSAIPDPEGRTWYGISHEAGRGHIIYKAAVSQKNTGEPSLYNCEAFIIKKGLYACKKLGHWRSQPNIIGGTFNELLHHPKLDRNGYCLEIYLNDNDVLCLVPLTTKE